MGIKENKKTGLQVLGVTSSIIVAAIVIWMVYQPALSAKAISFDDNQYLLENQLVQNPSWTSAGRFLTEVFRPSTVEGYYQPLAMISLMLDYAMGGRADNLEVFHRTSLCLHIANTALVIVLLYLLSGQVLVAAVFGLLFGLHPMTVETIAWIGERKTLLATFFSLLSLNFYVGYARRGGYKLYAGTLLAYVLALMSKPTSTPLPVLMLVLDYWPLNRLSKGSVLEKVPMFLIGIGSAAVTIVSQASTAFVAMPGEYPVTAMPLRMCHNIVFYLYKIIWPVNLSSHYPFPKPFALSNPTVLTGVIGTLVLMVLLLVSLRWTRAALAGWLFFFIAVFPTMQVIGFSDVIAADKFMYLPVVGLLLAGAHFWARLYDLMLSKWRLWSHLVIVGVAAVLGTAEAIETRRYLVHWHDTESLYLHMIRLTSDAAIPYNNLGVFYYQQGRAGEAIKYWAKAVVLSPYYADAINNLAWVLATHQDSRIRDGDKAVWLAEQACGLSSYKKAAYLDTLATAYAATGQFDKAVTTARRALELALASGRGNLAGEIAKKLKLYDNHEAYVEIPH